MYDRGVLSRIQEAYQDWLERYSRLPERPGKYQTLSGQPVEELYTPAHTADLDYEKDAGFPASIPLPGVQTNMCRGRVWTMRQFSGFGDAFDTNSRFRYLLAQGQTGLSVALMPTIMGYDSDHSRSLGEVGRCGVPLIPWPTWRFCLTRFRSTGDRTP